MADDNIFGQFSIGVTNNQLSQSTDGSQGVVSGINNKVLTVDSNLGKSLNGYAGKMFDITITDLSKGTGSLKDLCVLLTGKNAELYGVSPTKAEAAKFFGQTLGVTVGAR